MANPFGDVAVSGGNPFGDTPVTGGNPFGDVAVSKQPSAVAGYDPREDDTKMFSDPQALLAARSAADPSIAPSKPVEQFSLRAASAVNAAENAWLQHPDNLAAAADPEAQARVRQLKAEREITNKLLQDIQANDNAAAQLAGQAIQALPGSLASMALAPILPAAPAMGIGLGMNFLLEQSSNFTNRMDEFGQNNADAWAAALPDSTLATGLEMLPMHAVLKYMKGAAPLGKTMLKLGAGEAFQEGATTLFQDVHTNLEGRTDYGIGELAGRAGESAAVGALMAPMMGPFAGAAKVARVHGMLKEAKAEQAVVMEALQRQIKALETANAVAEAKMEEVMMTGADPQSASQIAIEEATKALRTLEEVEANAPVMRRVVQPDGSVALVPFEITPEDEALAAVQRMQMREGLELQGSSEAEDFATELQGKFGANADVAGEEPPVNPDEMGMSETVALRRRAEFNPNAIDLVDKPIALSDDPRAVGLTLRQAGDPGKGNITVVGVLSEHFPQEVYQPVMDLLRKYVQTYMPNARVVLDLSMLPEQTFGRHRAVAMENGSMIHVITPMDMLNMGRHEVSDPRTAMSLLAAVSHEMGHALLAYTIHQQLGGVLPLHLASTFFDAAKTGEIDPLMIAEIAKADPIMGRLLTEWYGKRASILSGKMTANEFVDSWAGLRKLGFSVARKSPDQQSLYRWAGEQLSGKPDAPSDLAGKSAKDVLLAAVRRKGREEGLSAAEIKRRENGWLNRQLNFHEYMAEQFSRAAYQNDALNQVQFGSVFTTALNKLRDMFKRLKSWKGVNGERLIEPSTTFQEWLVAQTAIAQTMGWAPEKFKLSPAILKKQKAVAKKALADKDKAAQKKALEVLKNAPAPKKKKKVEGQVAPPKEVVAEQNEKAGALERTLDAYEEYGYFEGKPKKLEKAKGLLERKQFVELEGLLQKVLEEQGEYEREYTSRVLKALPDKPVFKRATLQGYIGRGDIRAAEKKLWAKFLAENPEKMSFTPEELQTVIVSNGMPLTLTGSSTFADYGLWRLDFHPGNTTIRTTIFEGPFPTPRARHFGDEAPNYVAHTRQVVLDEAPETVYVVEIQSDNLAKQVPEDFPREDEERQEEIEEARQQWYRRANEATELLNFITGLENEAFTEEMWRSPAMDQPFAKYDSSQIIAILRAVSPDGTVTRKDLDTVTLRELQDKGWEALALANKKSDEAYQLLEKLRSEPVRPEVAERRTRLTEFRAGWYERVFQEYLAEQVDLGYRTVRMATLPTVVKGEGWPLAETIRERIENDKKLIIRLEQELAKNSTDLDVNATLASIQNLNKQINSNRELLATKFTINGTLYDKAVPVYNWYLKEFFPWLKKTYNPVEVTDKAGNTWYEIPLTSAMETVNMYDTDNPFADRNPRVRLDQYAGLTEEELRNPQMLAEAEAGWARSKTASPIFKRWFGESKVLLGGKPRLLWGTGVPQTMQKGQVWPLSSSAQNAVGRGGGTQVAARSANEYYLKMENPKMVPAEHLRTGDLGWELEVEQAKLEGYDGVIFKRMRDPLEADQFVVFSPEQMVRSQENTQAPSFEYDTDSPLQTATSQADKIVSQGWDYSKRAGLNLWAKIADNLVQLQQVAATQPDDFYLQQFVREIRGAEKLKNKLMGHAEDTVKDLMSIGSLSGGDGAGPAVRKKLHAALQAEWKSGELQGTLVGLDSAGNIVWGGETGPVDAGARALVATWEIQTGIKLRKFLMAQGIDPMTEAGARIEELYLRTRTVLVQQFAELATSMKIKAAKTFSSNPLMQNMERLQIDQMMMTLMQSPFVPTGHFGNHVLVIQRKQLDAKTGHYVWRTVKKQHFESETSFDLAFEKAQRAYRGDLTVKVQKVILQDEDRKLPLQMPAEFFERVAASGEFSDEQVDLLRNVMQLAKYDKIVEKYEKLSVQLEGGNEDFGRVFSDFTWHNANYIWKVRYRMQFGDTISLHKRATERLEQDTSLPLPDLLEQSKRLRRNHALMENQMNYILEPPKEYQSVRGYISLAYLAFGIKTAAMNASTNLNTIAAVTYEYGEGQGALHYGRALKNFWPAWRIAERRRNGEVVALTTEQQAAGLEPLAWAMERALEEGIIDQSFAYFLAGQANSEAFMRAMQGSTMGQLAHKTLEAGMMPFQGMEKFNRMVALLTFFSADQAEAKKEKLVKGMNLSYEKAIKRVDQTQNAYDAANRPRLFQGRKAIATMFMSYVQFQTWVMSGGIDKAIRADIVAENRFRESQGVEAKKLPSRLRSSQTKLWLIYLILAGPLGLPFFENIMDVARWLYRKLWPTEDLEVEIRKYIKDLGADPNLVLHGVSHDVWGFNVSGSLGLGRVIPGTDLMNKNFRNAEEFMGSQMRALGGPAGGFYEGIISALMLGAHGDWAEAGKQLPGAIGAVTKAIDAHIDQTNRPTYGVTAKNGKRMTVDLETGEYRDLTTKELVGMAMGFNPTILSVNREAHYRTSAEVMYWNIRRSDLMDKHRKAVLTQDEEGRLEVQEAVRKFNSEIPDSDLKLTNKDLNDNLRMMKKRVRKAEKSGTDSRMYRDVGRGIQSAYGLREE